MVFAVLGAWLAVGAAAGWWAARRGAWARLWVVTAVFGPFAVPLVLEARRRGAEIRPRLLTPAYRRLGAVDVLVGLDGSEAATAAASVAAELFGPRIGRITLATVLDHAAAAPHGESLLDPEPWQQELRASAVLDAGTQALIAGHSGLRPGAVLLAGEPADALERYAADEGYDVVVVGRRGRGASTLLLGSCAARLSRHPRVPVMVISEPGDGIPPAPEQGDRGAVNRAGQQQFSVV